MVTVVVSPATGVTEVDALMKPGALAVN